MAKYYGKIGYAITEETTPGVWEEKIVERYYYGDVIKNFKRYQNSDHLNDNINISNRLSIIADPFAYNNFINIRYVKWLGSKWKIESAEVDYPRLLLDIGGVYNE